MEYAPLVWQGAARSNLAKLDRIQQRCMRSIGAGTMLPSLSVRRQVSGLCYLFKLHYISGPAQLTDMLPPAAPEPAPPQNPPPTSSETLPCLPVVKPPPRNKS
eukprot:scpid106484/ scgid34395/ 